MFEDVLKETFLAARVLGVCALIKLPCRSWDAGAVDQLGRSSRGAGVLSPLPSKRFWMSERVGSLEA
jgi:hypothetical protein